MNDTLHEALKNFRSDFEPTMKAMLTSLTRTTSLIMSAYENIINTDDDADVKKEDTVFLADLRHHHDLLIHSVTYELDALQTIGLPRKVERYFNFENDDFVEVDKEHFAGLPDEDEDSSAGGRVLAFNHAPEE